MKKFDMEKFNMKKLIEFLNTRLGSILLIFGLLFVFYYIASPIQQCFRNSGDSPEGYERCIYEHSW
jgi:hypothetical protein